MSIPEILMLLLATGILYYGLFDLQEQLLLILNEVWSKVGVVMIALLPLTILLATVPFYLLLNKGKDNKQVILMLQIISFAAPSLGLLGTVLGTVEGTAAFSMAKGVEQLLNSVVELQRGLSVALLSTAWGTILSIPSGIMLILLTQDKSRSEKQIKSDEKSIISNPKIASERAEIFKSKKSESKTSDQEDEQKKATNISGEQVISTLSSLGISGVQEINKESL